MLGLGLGMRKPDLFCLLQVGHKLRRKLTRDGDGEIDRQIDREERNDKQGGQRDRADDQKQQGAKQNRN